MNTLQDDGTPLDMDMPPQRDMPDDMIIDMPNDMASDMSDDMPASEDMPDMAIEEPPLPLIAGGRGHTCAILGQQLHCWGSNDVGQRGDGTTPGADNRSTPLRVAQQVGQRYVSVVAGHDHSCALTNTGAVYCRGRNGQGQLGDGMMDSAETPVAVVGLDRGVARLAAGGDHTCAVKTDGALLCWGKNDLGQLGIGMSGSGQATPQPVHDMGSGVIAVALGDTFTCALQRGRVLCWGANQLGQLGTGTIAMPGIATPTPVHAFNKDVTHVALTAQSACTIKGGGVYCWGSDAQGTLATGDSAPGVRRIAPGIVTVMQQDATALGSGAEHLCALHAGKIKRWGSNSTDIGGIRAGSSQLGQRSTCAIMISGALMCWGDNSRGLVGDGTEMRRLTPTQVSGLTSGVSLVASAFSHACAVRQGATKCWGSNTFGTFGNRATSNSEQLVPTAAADGLPGQASALAPGQSHSCAVVPSGVYCWGDGRDGRLGHGEPTCSSKTRPAPVEGLTAPARSISAGRQHTCVVDSAGVSNCWGDNRYGQLGFGIARESTPRLVPLP